MASSHLAGIMLDVGPVHSGGEWPQISSLIPETKNLLEVHNRPMMLLATSLAMDSSYGLLVYGAVGWTYILLYGRAPVPKQHLGVCLLIQSMDASD